MNTTRAAFRAAVRPLALTAAIWAVAAALLSLAVGAQAADCSLTDHGYDGACGPQFELPAWGDEAGWTDPSKYTTIQLADLTGNGADELIAQATASWPTISRSAA